MGTYQIKVVVATDGSGERNPQVLGTGYAHSKGIRHGYIINSADLTRSLRVAIPQAEKASGTTIRRAFLSVGGVGLEEIRSRADTVVSRADSEVTALDVSTVIDESEKKVAQRLLNRKVIHVIPLSFRLDGERLLGRPHGLKGTKLEVETLFVTALEQHLQDLITAVENVGVSVVDVMAAPLAASFVTLTRAQKIAGCVLANIGAETVSIAVFENDIPISVKVFPIGSTDITHDIALGLQISLEDAEQAKKGALIGTNTISRKRLEDIIASRLADIFSLIEAHLKKIGKSGLLPAGVIVTGGGSGIATIEDIARASLHLPTKKAVVSGAEATKVKDATWAVAHGLCIWGVTNESASTFIASLKERAQLTLSWLRQFLP